MSPDHPEPPQVIAEKNRMWQDCFLPYSGGWVLLWFSLFLILGFAKMVLADGAVARHIETGLFIINNHAVPDTNYIWAINPQYPWLTHEFFGDVSIGAAYMMAGLKGVALLACIVIALCVMWSYQIGRVRGLGPLSGGILVFPMILATSIHWLSRSHIFSYIFFLIIYYLSFLSTASLTKKVLLTGLVMMIWSNFHGSIFLGLALLTLPFAAALLKSFATRRLSEDKSELLARFSIILAGAAGAMLNLRGGAFFLYIYNYLVHPEINGKGGEWRVLDLSFGISAWCFLILALAILGSWLWARKAPPLTDVLLVVGLCGAGIWSMRLIPYFALIALPVMGPAIATIRQRYLTNTSQSGKNSFATALFALDAPKSPAPDRQQQIMCLLKTGIFVGICTTYIFDGSSKITDFPEYKLPVQAMDYVITHKVSGLGFSFDNWGPYINWRTHSPIFIDEKTDFYPESFLQDYRAIYQASGNWRQLLTQYHFTYALLPPTAPLVAKLAAVPGWKQRLANRTSVLFVYTPDSAAK